MLSYWCHDGLESVWRIIRGRGLRRGEQVGRDGVVCKCRLWAREEIFWCAHCLPGIDRRSDLGASPGSLGSWDVTMSMRESNRDWVRISIGDQLLCEGVGNAAWNFKKRREQAGRDGAQISWVVRNQLQIMSTGRNFLMWTLSWNRQMKWFGGHTRIAWDWPWVCVNRDWVRILIGDQLLCGGIGNAAWNLKKRGIRES